MEKTPSVTIRRRRASDGLLQLRLQVGHVAVGVAEARALDSRMPSMMLAWLSASEMTASSSPSSVSNTPPLASKQEE